MKNKIRNIFYVRRFTWYYVPDKSYHLRYWVYFAFGFIVMFLFSRLGIL